MNQDAKKMVKVALTLALIASGAALIVSSLNLFTAPRIEANRLAKEKSGLEAIFAKAEIGESSNIDKGSLKKYWPVVLEDGESARIYSASGKNGYGAVSILIGVYSDFTLGRMEILENTETYGPTLQKGYVAPYQYADNAEDRAIALEDVSCGATYGAKLIKGMVLEAVAHYKEAQ